MGKQWVDGQEKFFIQALFDFSWDWTVMAELLSKFEHLPWPPVSYSLSIVHCDIFLLSSGCEISYKKSAWEEFRLVQLWIFKVFNGCFCHCVWCLKFQLEIWLSCPLTSVDLSLCFSLWRLLKNKKMFPLTAWGLQSPSKSFCLLAAECCLLLQLCRSPVMNPRAVVFPWRPQLGLELRFSEKQTHLFPWKLHSSIAAEQYVGPSVSELNKPRDLMDLWHAKFQPAFHQFWILFHVKG